MLLELYSAFLIVIFYSNFTKQTNGCFVPQVSVIPTPGHTGQDVSVEVRGLSGGTALCAGDLFERCDDEDSWQELSMDTALQEVHRQKALQSADIIIPGHGWPFRVLRS